MIGIPRWQIYEKKKEKEKKILLEWNILQDSYNVLIKEHCGRSIGVWLLENFFPNFVRFWYQKKAYIFLITPGEYYSWKMYRFEDINETENVIVMVTIINVTPEGIRNCEIHKLFLFPNSLTNLNEIWNQNFLGDYPSFEEISLFWEIGPGTFKRSSGHQVRRKQMTSDPW